MAIVTIKPCFLNNYHNILALHDLNCDLWKRIKELRPSIVSAPDVKTQCAITTGGQEEADYIMPAFIVSWG